MLLMLNVVEGSVGVLSLLILSSAINLSRWKANLQEFSLSEVNVPENVLGELRVDGPGYVVPYEAEDPN